MAVSSCRSSKTKIITDGDLTQKNKTEILKDVLDKELKYNTISGKVSLEISTGKKPQKVGAFVKIIKDSVIQLSIRPILGMEVFRLTLTPDSVHILDRMGKKYTAEDTKTLQEKVHFNFYNLQALFTNGLFVPENKSIHESDFSKFKISKADNMYLASIEKSKTTYNFAIDASDRIVSTLIFDKDKNTIQWSYKEFVKDGDYVYPTQMLAQIEAKNKRLNIGLGFSSLDINKKVEIDYAVSSKYDKVSINDIIKAYLK